MMRVYGLRMSQPPVRLSETVEIARPAAAVWLVIADYARDLQWRAGLTEMTPNPPGPPQNGTRVHEVLHAAGRTYVTDTVVSEVEQGSSYRFAGSGTSGDVEGRRIVRPLGGTAHSSFTYEIDLSLRGATALLRPLVARVMRSSLRRDLDTLRSLLEAGGHD